MNIYLKYIIDSFIINYKSWLAFIISIYTIRRHNFLIVVINLIILLMYSHIAHYIWHLNYIYPINIIHTNHHSNDNTYSEVAEIIMEIMLFEIFKNNALRIFVVFPHAIKTNIDSVLLLSKIHIYIIKIINIRM